MTDYTKKIAELQADVHTIWKLQCQNLYNSKNLAALAIRECLQNSLDAIDKAVRLGQISKEEAFVSIIWSGNDVTVEDNGIGMTIEDLHTKFLTLGGTTKGDENSVGGFGIAKSVILGCGTGFKVETQDNVFTSDDLGKNPIGKQDFRQGTKITLYSVQTGKGTVISDNESSFLQSVLDYILSSDIETTVKINGKVYSPFFNKSIKTRRMPATFGISSEMIPDKTKLNINVYKDNGVGSKYLYVRLRGLTQFKQYLGWNANCNIVLDFQTKLDPRSTEYPFSTNREGLKAQYYGIVEAIRDKVSQSPLSISSDDEYRETLYDNVNNSVEQARAISASISNTVTSEITLEVSKVIDGIIPQGGVKKASIADKAKQYNETLEDMAKQQGISKSKLIKEMTADTAKKIDNPLEHSWMVWEDKKEVEKKLNKNHVVDCIIVWDSLLRLMASNYEAMNGKVFYPGVVVKKDTLGLCVEKNVGSSFRTYIMLNPLEVPTEDDQQTALYLMGVAAHELAHFQCGCFEAHGETFSYTREAIMNANLSQLNNIVKLVKAGKLRKTLGKLHKTNQKSEKESFPIDFVQLTLDEIKQMAIGLDINMDELEAKYTNEPILRMRTIMAIKKAYKQQ